MVTSLSSRPMISSCPQSTYHRIACGSIFVPKEFETLWLARYNSLLTNECRASRGMASPASCMVCQLEEETVVHVLRTVLESK